MRERLNPIRFLLVPGLVAISLLILAAALQLAALLIPSGAILFIIGLRIAYNHRRAGDAYLRVMHWNVPRILSLAPETKRTLDGSIIAALGVLLAGVAVLALVR
jgi:hypothetical protein